MPCAICYPMTRSIAASVLALLVSVGAYADEPVILGYPVVGTALPRLDKDAKAFQATYSGASTGKVIYSDASSDLSVALCGLEGHKDAADLDAGLLDFNVADPARAAGGVTDDPKDLGRSRYDYRSSVVLGVTLGYRF
jgi:hypothetical protein